MTPDRRGQRPLLRFLLWFVAPFDERLRGLSLVRILAALCYVFVGFSVIVTGNPLTGVDLGAMTLGVCAAYGKKFLLAYLQRFSFKASAQDITQRMDIRREPLPTDDERG